MEPLVREFKELLVGPERKSFLWFLRRNRVDHTFLPGRIYPPTEQGDNDVHTILFASTSDYEKAWNIWHHLTGSDRLGILPTQ